MAAAATEEKKESVALAPKLEDVAKIIEGLTALELSELVKGLEDKFGIQAAAPMVAGAVMAGAPGAAAGGAAETSTSASKNLANNIVIPQQSRLLELKFYNYTAYDQVLNVEFGATASQASGSTTNSFDDNYFTTTVDAKAVGLFSAGAASGGTALPQAVGLAPIMLNVSNGDTADYPMEKILVMTANAAAAQTAGEAL